MTKVDGSIKSLLQGVSQQPPRDRLPGQCTEMQNMSADPVAGLSRRAPTDLVGGLVNSSDVRGVHHFQTMDGKQFLAILYGGWIKVFDYNATQYTVTVNVDAAPYLAATGKLAFGTVENEVIVSNTTIKPAMRSTLRTFANAGAGKFSMGIVQVLGGQYGRTTRVVIDGYDTATYTAPDGSSSTHTAFVDTDYIAKQLQTEFWDESPTYTCDRMKDVLLVKKSTAGKFKLTVSDGFGNINIKAMTDQVTKTADLPKYAPHGYLVRDATETDLEEDLYLEFVVEGWTPGDANTGTGFGQPGYWQETIASDVTYKIDTSTMPHVLEYNPTTMTFVFRRGNWKDRKVGTYVSNPEPSFIDNPITDITTFQKRLVFLSGRYVCMSRTNRYEDFWMGSASQLVDTDPVDISSTAVEASTMLAIVPNNRDLVVFSKKGQFIIFGRSAITPANATLVLTTTFEAELAAKPAPAGRYVYFATNYGRFTGIREFYAEGSTDINDARLITQHVKEYLIGKVSNLAASSNYDILLVQTQQELNTVYIYQYIWNDTEKIQSAWSKWVLPHDSIYTFFDEELIYFVMRDGRDHFLYRMSLDVYASGGVTYPVYLDSRFDIPSCYTSFVLPFDRLHSNQLTVVQGLNCPNPGMTAPIKSILYDATNHWWVVTLKINLNGGDAICGIPFMSEYEPTPPLIKDGDNVVIATGKLRIKHFICTMAETGHVAGKVLSKYGDGEEVEFFGRLIGAPENILGVPAVPDEVFYMPFREKNDRATFKLYTNKHTPMTILEIEWVGQYVKSGKRIASAKASSATGG